MPIPKSNHILFLLLSFFLLSQETFSQTYNWEWAKTAVGTDPMNEGWKTAIDSSENLYICGTYYRNISFDSCTLNNHGSCFLVKYDRYGNAIWARSDSIPGISVWNSRACGVCTDPKGNIFLCGGFKDTTYFGSHMLVGNSSNANSFLTKYDSSGNVLWAKSSFDTSRSDVAYSAVSDLNGNVFITGWYSSSISFDTCSLSGQGSASIFVAKFDSAGNIKWLRGSSGNSSNAYGIDVASDRSGNVYITGSYDSSTIIFGSYVLSNVNPNSFDEYLAKYDSSGNLLWAQTFGGTGYDEGEGLACDQQGNVFRVGILSFPLSAYIEKLDSNGTTIWSKNITGSSAGMVGSYALTTDREGSVYATGGYSSTSVAIDNDTIFNAPPSLTDPLFIVKYDSAGNFRFARTLNSGGGDWCGISVANSGSVYLGGGYDEGVFIVGNDTFDLTYGGGEQIFVAKLAMADVVSVQDPNPPGSETINLFPNPNTGRFHVQLKNLKSIKIYDVVGNLVYSKSVAEEKFHEIQLNVKSGIYILSASDGYHEYQRRVVIL